MRQGLPKVQQNEYGLRLHALLGGEVKVESGLEPVELELPGGEGPPGGSGGRLLLLLEGVESRLDGLSRLLALGLGLLLESGLVTGKVTASLVGLVKGVDKGVDTGAVSTVGHSVAVELSSGLAGRGEGGSVGVVLEVTVGGVVGVDEGVEVGVHGGINIVVVNSSLLADGSSWLLLELLGLLLTDLLLLLDRGSGSLFWVVGGRVETGGSLGHMGALQDLEAVLASRVSDSNGLAVVVNVAVLAQPLPAGAGLLSEDNAVLLGVGGTESAVAGVESLLLQDLGILGVDVLAGGRGNETGGNDKLKHFVLDVL